MTRVCKRTEMSMNNFSSSQMLLGVPGPQRPHPHRKRGHEKDEDNAKIDGASRLVRSVEDEDGAAAPLLDLQQFLLPVNEGGNGDGEAAGRALVHVDVRRIVEDGGGVVRLEDNYLCFKLFWPGWQYLIEHQGDDKYLRHEIAWMFETLSKWQAN